MTRTSETRKMYVPFYQLYTPSDLTKMAEFTTSYSGVTSTALSFGTDSIGGRRLFKLPLIPANVLQYNADIIVEITVGLDNVIRSGDSDPKVFISDGQNGIGFDIREDIKGQCRGYQAIMGDTSSSRSATGGSTHITSILQEQFVLTIKPYQRWGSCYTAADSGVISPVTYTRSINPERGLWLEVYREDTGERYVFNYIKVEIHEN